MIAKCEEIRNLDESMQHRHYMAAVVSAIAKHAPSESEELDALKECAEILSRHYRASTASMGLGDRVLGKAHEVLRRAGKNL